MSRRGELAVALGAWHQCRLCEHDIPPGTEALLLYRAPMPYVEPMCNFDGLLCHTHCWEEWSMRERFVEAFNRSAEDARLLADGSITWLPRGDSESRTEDCRIVMPERSTKT